MSTPRMTRIARPWTFGGDAHADYQKIHLPGITAPADVARALGVDLKTVLRTVVYRTDAKGPALSSGVDPAWIVAVVRGDHEIDKTLLNEAARENFNVGILSESSDTPGSAGTPVSSGSSGSLSPVLGGEGWGEGPAVKDRVSPISPKSSRTISESRPAKKISLPIAQLPERWPIGYVGPDGAIRMVDAVLIVDPDAAQHIAWAAGENEVGYHAKNFNWFRECGDRLADPRKTAVGDIRLAGRDR